MNSVLGNKATMKAVGLEILIMIVLGVMLYLISSRYDILEKIVSFSHKHEKWEIDEMIIVSVFFMFALAALWIRRLLQLREALSEIKQLRGILPICAVCKKIRDDQGYWNQIEAYIQEHSDAKFTHGICPECMKELYSELDDSNGENDPPLSNY